MIANDSNAMVNDNQTLTALAKFAKGAIKGQTERPTISPDETADVVHRLRETGDQVNGFMLCALVSQSAKRIKGRAERVGVPLPMSMITRSVLNAYLVAAKDRHGPFASVIPDLLMISQLNEKVLQEVLARHRRDSLNGHRV